MLTKTFKIPADTVSYLQRLSFEQNARENVIDRIITSHKLDADASVLDSVVFKQYMSDLAEVTAEYELAKAEIPSTYFGELSNHEISWELDYSTRIATVNVLCDCELENA